MGGVVSSAGGFLGLSGGPQAPGGQFTNQGLGQLNNQNGAFDNTPAGQNAMKALTAYSNGGLDSQDAMSQFAHSISGGNAGQEMGFNNELATGALTGSKFAADQLAGNQTQNGLYGQNGQLGQVEGKLNNLYNQGFDLKPEDQTMYGQMSGNIARQFGQQGNQTANDLAARGLSSSGAAGAAFSGLAGNQNEMLANAQQQIAQQRFQNTMNQIGQYQNFASNLGGQYNNALQQQYGRQLSGAQNQTSSLEKVAGLQGSQNQSQNQYGLDAANFNVKNTPKNFMDSATSGASQGAQSGVGGAVSGLFG